MTMALPRWLMANWISNPSSLRPAGDAMIPALHMRMSSRSWANRCKAALTVESEPMSIWRKVRGTDGLVLATSEMTVWAAVALRPVKYICAGSCFASASTDSLPRPAVPAVEGRSSV